MENALSASLEEFIKDVEAKKYYPSPDKNTKEGIVICYSSSLEIIPFHLRKNGYSGIYRYACGSWYKGEWHAGKRHGKGKLTLVTGDIYEGEFVNGKRHGSGIQYLKKPIEGIMYKGEW